MESAIADQDYFELPTSNRSLPCLSVQGRTPLQRAVTLISQWNKNKSSIKYKNRDPRDWSVTTQLTKHVDPHTVKDTGIHEI